MANWQTGEDGKTAFIQEGQVNLEVAPVGSGWRVHERDPALGRVGIGQVWDTMAAAISDAESVIGHRREVESLGRERVDGPKQTPWGRTQAAEQYGQGVIAVHTEGHGGFRVHAKQNRQIPEALRNEDGWYEEDCEWSAVALGHPDLFTARECELAERTAKNWMPDAYEATYGVELEPGESFVKDRRMFHREHADDLVAVSALKSAEHTGMVEVAATVGGERQRHDGPPVEQRLFLVPEDEYGTRSPHGFVVDPERHDEIPSAPGMKL